MLTWKRYLEDHEKQEEKTGLDLDHDKEKGESPAHKARVVQAKKDLIDFFRSFLASLAKIAVEAKAKGGPAMLTTWHFAAKAQPYAECLRAIKEDKPLSFYRAKATEFLGKIKCLW